MHPAEELYEEAAFIAYYAHWSFDEIMALPHGERSRFCMEFSKINSRYNEEPENVFEPANL